MRRAFCRAARQKRCQPAKGLTSERLLCGGLNIGKSAGEFRRKTGMRDVSLVIQGGIGVALAAGGIYLLLRNRGGRTRGEFVYAAACVLAGVFLLGYAVCRIA